MIEIPSEVSDLVLWTGIVAFFAPVVLDLIIQSGWKDRTQSIVAFLASAVIGVVSAYFSGAFNGAGIVTGILIAFVVTISAYKGFWQKVTPDLKAATSVKLKQGSDSTWRKDDLTG